MSSEEKRITPRRVEAVGEQRLLADAKATFDRYSKHLGLTEHSIHLAGKNILDAGAGRDAAFGDWTVLNFPGSRVVSVDDDDHFSAGLSGVDKNRHIKIPNMRLENLRLKDVLGQSGEPGFDLIVSEASFPHTLVTESCSLNPGESQLNTRHPNMRYGDWIEQINGKMKSGFLEAVAHLNSGGHFIVFPVFGFGKGSNIHQSGGFIVDMGKGGRFDFGGWAASLHDTIDTIVGRGVGNMKFIVKKPEEVDWVIEGEQRPIKAQRLIIQRTV